MENRFASKRKSSRPDSRRAPVPTQMAIHRVSVVPRLHKVTPVRASRKQRSMLWLSLVGVLALSMGVETGDEHTMVLNIDQYRYFYPSYAVIVTILTMVVAYLLYKFTGNKKRRP